MNIRYFDNAATTRVKDEVLHDMLPYFGIEFGNPSSMYSIGRSAKRAIEQARKQVADYLTAMQTKFILLDVVQRVIIQLLKELHIATKIKVITL